MIETLTNENFIEIMKKCCKNGQINDEKLNLILQNYFPYNLCFGKGGPYKGDI